MSLEIVRRIRDNLHGSIDISELENAVLAHPYVQRLRRIKQLAFLNYVFPGATHTRFEHSLGVMHLASVAWGKLQANQKRLFQALCRYGHFEDIETHEYAGEILHGRLTPTFSLMGRVFHSDYVLQVIRLAGLLHDLGHPPFSHSGERFLPSLQAVLKQNPNMSDYLRQYIESRLKADPNGSQPCRHEIFSMLMIDQVLADTYRQQPHLSLQINPRDVIAVISEAIDPADDSPLIEHQAYTLCRELISGELDIDRMDYLLRDSRECGVVYGVFDVDRILDSLCLYFDEDQENLHVAINLSGLAAFEDYLRARHSMYLQLYFHKSAVGAEAMMQHLTRSLKDWRLPAALSQYAKCDEYNIGSLLENEVTRQLKGAAQTDALEHIDRLLFQRQLWKRVFEVTGPKARISTETLEKVSKILTDHGVDHERISSANSLTRFQPRRDQSAKSLNYLRLIKKDDKQFPRVFPIEDHSEVIRSNSEIVIHRIYVEPRYDSSGRDVSGDLRQLIHQNLKQSSL